MNARSIGVVVLLAATIAVAAAWAAMAFSPRHAAISAQGGDIGPQVREYLLNNPEVIAEAVEVLRAREQRRGQMQVSETIRDRRAALLYDRDAPVGGDPDGDVTLVEFYDYNCGYCRRAAPTVTQAIEADGDLRVVYKEFPILGPGSVEAARVALAVSKLAPEKFVEFHDRMMALRSQADGAAAMRVASEIGIDVEKLKLDDPAIDAAIGRNMRLAQELGITGTPSFVVGDKLIPGAVELPTLQQAIDSARVGG